jgi:DNA polymerase
LQALSIPILFRDIETYSTLNLTKVGAWRYAGDPSTGVWCVAYAVDDGAIQIWTPDRPIPEEFRIAATDPAWTVVAHHDAFESAIEERLLAPRYGWPLVPIERHRCTQAMALAAALPAKLETVAAALNLPIGKDTEGVRVMREMAKPRKPRPDEDPASLYWVDDSKKLRRLIAYNVRDVETERALYRRLPPLSDAEQILWQLDAAINRRGFHVDIPLAEAARKIVVERRATINRELAELTGGRITDRASQQNRRLLKERGHKVAGVGKRSVAAVLAHRPDEDIARLLRLRREGGKASASKLDALFDMANDDRIHNALRFHTASTGRWAGSGFQPHNLIRAQPADPEAAIAAVMSGDLTRVGEIGPPLEVVGSLSRALICAPPAKVLISADFSSIEPRVLCWLAGETWKLDAFRRFDATGDLALESYCVVASKVLGRTVTPADEEGRQIGKYMELAFGYGGVMAFRKIAPDADFTDAQIVTFNQQWRAAHPKIVKFWGDLHRMLLRAVRPGKPQDFKNLHAEMRAGTLYLRLPSGRELAYPEARIEAGQYGDQIVSKDNAIGKWRDVRGWHGTSCENVVRAVSRDLLAAAMQRLEAAGYPIVLHVHDEIVAEVPEGFGSPDEFAKIMTELPRWAEGLPLAAKARVSKRYAKNGANAAPEDEPPIAEEGEEPHEPEPEQAAPRPNGNGHDDTDDGYTFGAKPHGTTTDCYVYKDAGGLLFMRVTRTSNKTFPTEHWQDGRWVRGWPKTVVPYRLLEMLAAPATEPIWIAEGEKDVNNVAALGLIATTNPGGAKVWQADLAQWFKDKQIVYILEDSDEPGRGHTAKILAALTGIVPNIAVVAFPELPEGGDISDWLAIGGNKKLLIARAEQALKQSSKHRAYIATDLSDVKPRAIRWLWHKHLARGALELLAGMPTVGKSQIQCQYVACATTGRDWPNGAPGIIPCRVIMLTAEDNTDDTLVPRLVAAGADLSRIKELKAIRRNGKEELFLLGEDLAALEQMIRDWGDVGLVTIDPITAYMGHAKHFDSHRATDVRSQLSPLKVLAERTGVAISAVTHPPKNVGQRALDHFIGSQAFIAAARLGHLCIEEMTEDAEGGGKQASGRYLFADAKPSIKAKQPTLAYRIAVVQTPYCDPDSDEPIEAPVICWEGDSLLSADEAIAASRPGKARAPNAQDFLNDILAGGKVPQKTVIERGAAKGFSYHQLWRAKAALGVEDFKEKGVQAGPSYWALPKHVPDETEP